MRPAVSFRFEAARSERSSVCRGVSHRDRAAVRLLAGSLLCLALVACKSREALPANQNRTYDSDASAWLIVDESRGRALESQPIYRQGPSSPELLRRVAVEVPPNTAAAPQSPLIVSAVISADGRVVRARVLRRPNVGISDAALIAALQEWRFSPARLDGRPVPVYYNLTLQLQPSRTMDERQR